MVAANASAAATPLYQAYAEWCEKAREKVEKQKVFGGLLRERSFEDERITSGPNKGRKAWLGIGLRHDGNDDPGGGGEPSESNGSPEKSLQNTGEPDKGHAAGERSEPENDKNALLVSRVETLSDIGSLGSLGSPDPPESAGPSRRLTEEEARKVQRRIREGMKPELARREVLGEGT